MKMIATSEDIHYTRPKYHKYRKLHHYSLDDMALFPLQNLSLENGQSILLLIPTGTRKRSCISM